MLYYWIETDKNNKPQFLWLRIPKLVKGENIFQIIRTSTTDFLNPKNVFPKFVNSLTDFKSYENIMFLNNQITPENSDELSYQILELPNTIQGEFEIRMMYQSEIPPITVSLSESFSNSVIKFENDGSLVRQVYINSSGSKTTLQVLPKFSELVFTRIILKKQLTTGYIQFVLYLNNTLFIDVEIPELELFKYIKVGTDTPVNFRIINFFVYQPISNVTFSVSQNRIFVFSNELKENVNIQIPQNLLNIKSPYESLKVYQIRRQLLSPVLVDEFNNVIKQQIGVQKTGEQFIINDNLIDNVQVISLRKVDNQIRETLFNRVYNVEDCRGNTFYNDFENFRIVLGRPVEENEVVVQLTMGTSIFDGLSTLSGVIEFITNSEEEQDRTKIQKLKLINTEEDIICRDITIQPIDLVDEVGQKQEWITLSEDGVNFTTELNINVLEPNSTKEIFVKGTIEKDTALGRWNDVGIRIKSINERVIVKYKQSLYELLSKNQEVYIPLNNNHNNYGKSQLPTSQQFNIVYNPFSFDTSEYYQVFNGTNSRIRVFPYNQLQSFYHNKNWTISFMFNFTGTTTGSLYCIYSYGFGYQSYYTTQEITGHRVYIDYKSSLKQWFLNIHQYYTYTTGSISDPVRESFDGKLYVYRRGNEGIYGIPIVPNKWYNVVMIYNNSSQTLDVYINGYLYVKGLTFNNPKIWNQYDNEPFTLGQYTYDNSQSEGPQSLFFKGYLKDFLLFNRPLTEWEINIIQGKWYYINNGTKYEII